METTYTIEFMRPAEPTIAPIKQPSAFHVAYYCNPGVGSAERSLGRCDGIGCKAS
jgi:hypothetical protein